jgi:hypothetical protein
MELIKKKGSNKIRRNSHEQDEDNDRGPFKELSCLFVVYLTTPFSSSDYIASNKVVTAE